MESNTGSSRSRTPSQKQRKLPAFLLGSDSPRQGKAGDAVPWSSPGACGLTKHGTEKQSESARPESNSRQDELCGLDDGQFELSGHGDPDLECLADMLFTPPSGTSPSAACPSPRPLVIKPYDEYEDDFTDITFEDILTGSSQASKSFGDKPGKVIKQVAQSAPAGHKDLAGVEAEKQEQIAQWTRKSIRRRGRQRGALSENAPSDFDPEQTIQQDDHAPVVSGSPTGSSDSNLRATSLESIPSFADAGCDHKGSVRSEENGVTARSSPGQTCSCATKMKVRAKKRKLLVEIEEKLAKMKAEDKERRDKLWQEAPIAAIPSSYVDLFSPKQTREREQRKRRAEHLSAQSSLQHQEPCYKSNSESLALDIHARARRSQASGKTKPKVSLTDRMKQLQEKFAGS